MVLARFAAALRSENWHAKYGILFFGFRARFRRLVTLSIGVLIAASIAGSSSVAWAASGRISLESGGITRSAILVEHARLKKSRRPVIIILHGGGGSAKRVRHMLGLEEKSRSASPIMVYPDAIGAQWSHAAEPGTGQDSVFIRDLIAKLVSEGIADRHRIFIAGGSSGGLMALKLACSGDADFAGVVVYFASLPADLAESCKPLHPTPFLLILATADPSVPYNGGESNLLDVKAELLSGKATLDLFGKLAGCGPNRTTTAFADHDTRDKSRAFLDKLNGCKVPVELLRIEGGGHLLPRIGAVSAGARVPEDGSTPPGVRNRDVDAPLLIWDFLRRLGA